MHKPILRGLNVFILFILIATSCSVSYTMGGADTGEAKTFSVKYFPNNAEIVLPTLSQSFTDALKDKFINDTKLSLVNTQGDIHFEGEIVEYSTAPLAIQENDRAAQNRLTVGVKVTYMNKFNEKFQFENTSFRRFADYPADKQLSDVENELIGDIIDELVEDVFNKSVVNW